MPNAPYLIFGLDVIAGTRNGPAIIRDVEDNFPISIGITSLGVSNVFLVEVAGSSAPATFRSVATYLNTKDQAVGGRLRWFVQLCRSDEIAGN